MASEQPPGQRPALLRGAVGDQCFGDGLHRLVGARGVAQYRQEQEQEQTGVRIGYAIGTFRPSNEEPSTTGAEEYQCRAIAMPRFWRTKIRPVRPAQEPP
ncbi:hypothetical protein [Kitasatospora sp. NPDC051705]|uniref:hypothetical protein n=1 Tax=Kitasatospora sp. NPDC051705 TaxID=3364057 RepID=UPI0037B36331